MASTLTDPMIGRLVDGRYEVSSRIARGGMATVYLATDRRLDRQVALKIMHPHLAEGADVAARFRREARAAARLAHPGIVGVYDQGSEGELNYLTLEYVEGRNLRRELRARGALSVGDALDIVESVLDALAAAHRAGLVHRDMKPENVLMAADGRVKVADFGLARAVTEATAASTGNLLGTVAYLSPEIVTSGEADARADVYAVGILLYEMLTGHPPFEGETPIQVAYKHVHESIPPASDGVPWLPLEIDDLIATMTARDVADRPVDAGGALALVRRVHASLDPAALAVRADVDADEVGEIVADARAESDGGSTVSVSRHTGTIALPIGAVAADDDAEAERRSTRRRKRRRRLRVISIILVVLLALGGGTWWYLRVGPGAYTAMPDVTGTPEAAALAELEAQGLRPATSSEHHDEVPAGMVITTDPGPGDDVLRDGGQVSVVVSLGIEMLTVPDLAGTAEDDAVATLTADGFELDPEVSRPWDAQIPAGTVIGTDPAAGESIAHNSPVTVVVSAGREPITVPNVVGADEATALEQLANAGAEPQLGPAAYSDSVGAGDVISQSLEGPALRGDLVEVIVSLGPELFEVPNVFGSQYADAEAELTALGFEVRRENVLGGVFGTVHSQSVPAGEMHPAGTVIVLTVV
ncbi:Stk1 family PASTA domain-containing Ser/Thr kinase [Occultella glacieicola]|uniref:non-specific serine/threonine protein kinase n=1 Tax=Occultella glacieicola TaxID=2518684 RepID=A0ABY2E175_9MICO|nr:Stk1 family PASTA domain-containing Ser/Thr kinase [Occultella glacieicola]TDE88952.1 Stk1 family PASTA domain-containing Ser/Thr kinase [Occultella glacieicola]